MPALSAPDRALWISHPYKYEGYLWIDRPPIIFQARVNQGLWTTNPDVEIPFDTVTTGAYTDVLPGLTFLLGSTAGADDLGRGRIRKAATSTIMYIGESSRGDKDGEITASDNDYITVLNDRRIWAVHPRYVNEAGVVTTYKDYDIEVITGGRNYAERPGPKANGGCDRAGLVASGTNLSTFTFSDESLYISEGSVFASRLWGVGDGTITVGSTTSASITATFPIGRRYITLTVTDDNGDSHTHYILVASLSLTHATYKPIQQFEVVEDKDTELGKGMAFIIREDLPYGTYYDGVEVIYFEVETYGATAGSLAGPDTAEGVKFVGWHQVERESPEAILPTGIQKDLEFRCVSTAQRMKEIVLLPQLLKYKSSPEAWDETLVLDNQRLAWYLMNWHSTVMMRANFILPGGFDEALKKWATTAGDLWGQCEECAKARGFKFTCDKRGILRMLGNVQILASADRTATVIIALSTDDYGAYEYERKRHPDLYWLDGSGITTGEVKSVISALFAVAQGDAPGQGAQRAVYGGLIVEDQSQLNDWVGGEYARLNSPWLPFKIVLSHTGDAGIDPALMEWITITVPSDSNRRGRALTTQRCWVYEVNTAHSNDIARTKEVELTCWIEVASYPAATRTIEVGSAEIPPISPGGDIFPIIPPSPEIAPVQFTASPAGYLLNLALDKIVRTRNVGSGVAAWELFLDTGDFAGSSKIDDFALDAWNPKGAMYVLTHQGNVSLQHSVWYVENLNGAVGTQTITLLHTQGDTRDDTFVGQIVSSINIQGGVYCIGSYVLGGNRRNQFFGRDSYVGAWRSVVTQTGDPVPNKWPGLALAYHASSASSGKMAGTGDASVRESADMGLSWGAIVSMAGDSTSVHYPYNNNASDQILYISGPPATGSNTAARIKRRNADGTFSDIAPYDAATTNYAAVPEVIHSSRAIHTYTENRFILTMLAQAGTSVRRIWKSDDGGDSWTAALTVDGGSRSIGGWPYDPNIIWINGHYQPGAVRGIWWSDDRCATVQNMIGDYDTAIETYAGHAWFVPVWVP